MTSELVDADFLVRLGYLYGEMKPFTWAKKVGIPLATFKRIVEDGVPPKANHLKAIAAYSGVNLNWLLTGEGERFIAQKRDNDYCHQPNKSLRAAQNVADDYTEFEYVPLYDGSIAAGPGAFNGHDRIVDRMAFRRDWLKEKALDPKCLALVKVTGDSMTPTIGSGDMVLFDIRSNEARDNAIYAIEVSGHVRVKRLQPMMDGSILVQSDNPAYKAETVSAAEAERVRVIGRAVWVGKSL